MAEKDISQISDSQAEGCLIGSIIAHPEFLDQIEFLKPKHFYLKENGCLFWAISELWREGVNNIDVVNLSNKINDKKSTKYYVENKIADLQNYINMSSYVARSTIDEVLPFAKKITTLAYKRDLHTRILEADNACFNDEISLVSLSGKIDSLTDELNEQYLVTSNDIIPYGDKIDNLWNEIVNRRTENGLSGIPFKFPTLNTYVTLEKTECVAIAARLKKGKSALLMNQAIYGMQHDIPTVYFDTEMSDRLFHERLLANLTGIAVRDIKTGNYEQGDLQKIKNAQEWIKSKPFYHQYLPEYTKEELYSIHKMLKNKMNLELSIFDYIKSNAVSASDNYNLLGQLADFLKNEICGKLDLAMLTAVQLNRENQIADSDKLARYLSCIIYWDEKTGEEIQRDGGLDYGNYKLRVGNNRLGMQMTDDEWIDVRFDGNHMRIEEAKQHIIEEPFNEN